MPVSGENPFQRFWNLGYRSLISIIPAKGPAAGYAARSSSYLGKAPGYFDEAAGLWRGRRNWQHYEATKTDLVRWFEQGANVGLRLKDLLAIDIDASDPATAAEVEQMALAALGPSPCRIGRAPRRMLLYRLSEPMRYTIISFDRAGENEKIEFSTGKRQMVVHGVHAKTGKLYEWPREIVARDELTVVTPQQVESLVRDLRAVLPPSVLSVEGSGTDRANVNQEALRGPADHVRAAVEALPNNRDIYPNRDDYIRVGVALKAALEDDNEAFELWCDWAAKYDDGGQPELWSKDWRGMQPPYEIGAGWLYDEARKVAGWTGIDNAIAATFGDPEAFAAAQAGTTDGGLFPPPKSETRTYSYVDFNASAAMALTSAAEPLIEDVLDQGAMTVLYGESNTGKTFVAMDMAYHVASGRPWAGKEVARLPVLYVAAEGGRGVHKRTGALAARLGPIDGFRLLLSPIDLLRADADTRHLIADIRGSGVKPGLIVIDTLSRVLAGGDENSSTDMGAMVKHLDALRHASNAHLMVVHHSGKDTARGARGHSLLRAATDTEIEVADRQIVAKKQRDLDGSFSMSFELDVVTLGLNARDKPVTSCVVRLLAPETEMRSVDADMATRIARAVDVVMADIDQCEVNGVFDTVSELLRADGVTRGKTRRAIVPLITSALIGEGRCFTRGGQIVRIKAFKNSGSATAPWLLRRDTLD